MPITCTPEIGIPFPTDTTPEDLVDFREKAHALFSTLRSVLPEDTPIVVTHEEKVKAHDIAKSKCIPKTSELTTGIITNLESVLIQYDYEIMDVANKLRNYVTNRLIEESTSSNDKHRLKALELLGKMSSVKIFSDNVNVNVTHRSIGNIEEELRKTLRLYSGDVLDVDVLDNVRNLSDIDLDEELGREDGSETTS